MLAAGHLDADDLLRLTSWYGSHVGDHTGPFAAVGVATAGRSNVTLVLTDAAGRRTVLRRPPAGDHLPTAHDVCREGRIMKALGGTGVPVPPVAAICEDTAVIGTSFFVMDFVDGTVLDTAGDAAAVPATERRHLGIALARHLATLHGIHPATVGLAGLARADGFVERQLRRFGAQWRGANGTSETEMFGRAHELLMKRQPPDVPQARIVHGDFRLGNTIVADGVVAAVLDWELTTLGHPLSDLGYLLNNWVDATEADDGPITSPTAAGGFGSRDDIVAAYRSAGGDVGETDLAYFRAFSYWRLASIRSGVVARLHGSTDPAARARVDQSSASIPKLLTSALTTLGHG